MTKHTPGPWEVYNVSGGEIGIRAKLIEFKIDEPLTFFCVPTNKDVHFKLDDTGKLWGHISYSQWVQFYPKEWTDRQEANARLIAAAPDLLELVKSAIELGRLEGKSERNIVNWPKWFTEAKQAIAKATE